MPSLAPRATRGAQKEPGPGVAPDPALAFQSDASRLRYSGSPCAPSLSAHTRLRVRMYITPSLTTGVL